MLLDADPRWAAVTDGYAKNLGAFVRDVLNVSPTGQQDLLFESVGGIGSRTTVTSGHGTGKSFSIAAIILWHLVCYYKSNTLVTAPRIEQVKNVTWKEVADLHEKIELNSGFSWLAKHIRIDAERIYIHGYKKTWFVIAKTAPKGNPENMAGMHRDWYLVLADEASGISDANYGVLTGALTDRRNRMLMTSQPTRPSGFFYDSHHKLSAKNGGSWVSLTFNSEDSPLVSAEFREEKRLQYTEVEYDIKVRGRFPDKTEGFLLGRSEVESCFDKDCVTGTKSDWGWISSCDVGGGNWRDKSVLVHAKVWGFDEYGENARHVHIERIPYWSAGDNEISFAGHVFDKQTAENLISDHLLIDRGGGGNAVEKLLIGKGLPMVTGVLWGQPCWAKAQKDRFINQRAQANWWAARAVRDGRLTFSKDISQRLRAQILDEASRVPYHFDEAARIQMMKKEDMRREGIPSPDIWDAICHFFLESAHYSSAGSYYESNAIEEMMQEVENAWDENLPDDAEV